MNFNRQISSRLTGSRLNGPDDTFKFCVSAEDSNPESMVKSGWDTLASFLWVPPRSYKSVSKTCGPDLRIRFFSRTVCSGCSQIANLFFLSFLFHFSSAVNSSLCEERGEREKEGQRGGGIESAMDEGSSAEVLVLTRRASVFFGEAISDWWKEINESPQWQDTIFYLLSASYALVSAIALVCWIQPSIFFPSYILVPEIWIFHLSAFQYSLPVH